MLSVSTPQRSARLSRAVWRPHTPDQLRPQQSRPQEATHRRFATVSLLIHIVCSHDGQHRARFLVRCTPVALLVLGAAIEDHSAPAAGSERLHGRRHTTLCASVSQFAVQCLETRQPRPASGTAHDPNTPSACRSVFRTKLTVAVAGRPVCCHYGADRAKPGKLLDVSTVGEVHA
eukprot:SAG11_NODE_2157_length_3731_cov_10.095540_2_plen_175_part_00